MISRLDIEHQSHSSLTHNFYYLSQLVGLDMVITFAAVNVITG